MGGTGGGQTASGPPGGQFAEGGCSSAGALPAIAMLGATAVALRLRRRR